MVETLDQRVGQVISAARARLGDDLVIVYASDHGDMAGDLGMFWKSSMYEGSVRVPLILSGGAEFTPGSVRTDTVSLLDLGPTLLELSGSDPLPICDGMSLLSRTPCESVEDGERAAVAELAELKGDAPCAMIRRGRWKLVTHAGYPEPQLFDLSFDPKELVDRGLDSDLADVRGELLGLLGKIWDEEAVSRALDEHRKELAVFTAFARNNPEPMNEYFYPRPGENLLFGDSSSSLGEDVRA
jgi:choline-sulfatase